MRILGASLLLLVFAPFMVIESVGQEAPHGRPPANPAHETRDAYDRQQFFWQQRAYPRDFLPATANVSAIRQRDRVRRAFAAQSASSATTTGAVDATWFELGPRPLPMNTSEHEVSGRVTAVATDPRDNNVVFLGTANGGIWKSTDGGANWTPLTDAQLSLSIGAIAVAPASSASNAPLVIYAGTGEGNFSFDSYYGVGILKSTDGGTTWVNMPGPFGALTGINTPGQQSYAASAHISAIATMPGDPNTVLVGAQFPTAAPSGIYRSTDGGLTWTQTLSGDAGTELIFSTYDSNTVFASLGHFGTSAAGVFRSSNAGLTWIPLSGSGSTALPSTNVGRIALAATRDTPWSTTTLWAGVEEFRTGNLLGLYKSSDGGNTWVIQPVPDYCAPQCWYANVVAISPANRNVVFAGGGAAASLYRTTDGGVTWTSAYVSSTGTVHKDHHVLRFTPDGSKLFDGSDGGVWSTLQPGGTVAWTNLNHTLGTLQFHSGMSVSPVDEKLAFAGAQEFGTQKYSNGTWSSVTCSDGGFTAIDPVTPSAVYAACSRLGIQKSINGGTTFTASNTEITAANDRVQFIAPLTIDTVQPQNLYFGTYRVWQTRNGARSWAPVSADLTGASDKYISAIAVAPSDSASVYVGTSGGRVFRTTNVFALPVIWSGIGLGLPARYVASIAVDSSNPGKVLAGFSGFSYGTDTLGHVFESVDHGASWLDISGDLPNTPVNQVLFDPDIPNTIYAATDIGVFRTTNGGASWLPLGHGLPNVPVTSLALHQASRTLIAATYGRGAWQLNVSDTRSKLSAAQLDFGLGMIGLATKPQTLTFTNASAVPVTMTAQVSLSDYTISSTCPNTIATGASCDLTVTFVAAALGTRNATLTVVASDSPVPLSATLLGSGAAQISPKLTVDTTAVNFGTVAVGNTAPARRVTLRNIGNSTLNISSVYAAPTTFTLTHDCGTYVTAGGSCSVSLTIRPIMPATYSGMLLIASNDPGGMRSVPITAIGVAAVDGRHVVVRKPRFARATQVTISGQQRLVTSSAQKPGAQKVQMGIQRKAMPVTLVDARSAGRVVVTKGSSGAKRRSTGQE